MTPLVAARRYALVCAALLATLLGSALAADAAPPQAPTTINIVQIDGVIDPAYADYIADEIRYSESRGHLAVLLRLESAGSMKIDDVRLLKVVQNSTVPVATWIGPDDAKVSGLAAVLWNSGDIQLRSKDARVGPLSPLQPGGRVHMDPLGKDPKIYGNLAAVLSGSERVSAATAATLREAVSRLDGKEVDGKKLVVDSSKVTIRFATPGLFRRVRHSLINPTLVYLLLLAGVFMLVFEAFQPGFGPAGYAGALTVALSAYGLIGLPTNPPFLALLAVGLAAMTYDVARNSLGPITWGGAVAFTAGSVFLFHSNGPAMRVPWIAVTFGVVSSLVFFAVVMTVVLRALRGQTAAMGQALLGRIGEVRSTLNPQGHVLVEGALWRARAIEWDGPVGAGTKVQVTGVDQDALVLDVEPVPAD
jgi:membrane-bound serine protease (ClpP class)